jgi:hypothetical protein
MTQEPTKSDKAEPTPSKHTWLEEMRAADMLTPQEIEELKAEMRESAQIGRQLFREKLAKEKEEQKKKQG